MGIDIINYLAFGVVGLPVIAEHPLLLVMASFLRL